MGRQPKPRKNELIVPASTKAGAEKKFKAWAKRQTKRSGQKVTFKSGSTRFLYETINGKRMYGGVFP